MFSSFKSDGLTMYQQEVGIRDTLGSLVLAGCSTVHVAGTKRRSTWQILLEWAVKMEHGLEHPKSTHQKNVILTTDVLFSLQKWLKLSECRSTSVLQFHVYCLKFGHVFSSKCRWLFLFDLLPSSSDLKPNHPITKDSICDEGSDLANQLATKVVELNDEYKVPENLQLQRCKSTFYLLFRSCQHWLPKQKWTSLSA